MPMADSQAIARFLEVVRRNRAGEATGIYSICSAHPAVIEAGMRQAMEDGSLLLIESTSSQVNQFGGYTGQTPKQFAAAIRSAAQTAGLSEQMLLLGGDHLGPYPWRNQPAEVATKNGCDLVQACVLAGYGKIHLDASMACADDPEPALSTEAVAQRAALLCRAAENAHRQLPSGSALPLYVIGSEVPTPGGETSEGQAPAVTTAEQVRRTLSAFHAAFDQQKLSDAWERVIGLVLQPGVEFGNDVIFPYEQSKASQLSAALPEHPCVVYEAHSTDYQTPTALRQMVQDHFAILKVGPALTFAYREAIFALSAIERECHAGKRGIQLSQVREALEAAMFRNPSHWRPYYHGSEEEQRIARAFSFSDRCRYYWPDPAVQQQVDLLLANLTRLQIPLSLISQYLPEEYVAIRRGDLPADPKSMIQYHIRSVLREYAEASGTPRVKL
jgi:D-tagatose-1,6-bisphosphate aldolase subunit GatZ/KbaZ